MSARFAESLKRNVLPDEERKCLGEGLMLPLPLCGCSLFSPPGCVGKRETSQCKIEEIRKTDPASATYHEELQARWRANA